MSEDADLSEIQRRSVEIGDAAMRHSDRTPWVAMGAMARVIAAFVVTLNRSGVMREEYAIAWIVREIRKKAKEFNGSFRSRGEA